MIWRFVNIFDIAKSSKETIYSGNIITPMLPSLSGTLALPFILYEEFDNLLYISNGIKKDKETSKNFPIATMARLLF